uniref:Alkylated DNA repair protein AlkB homologue 8 N-terminal domain-containing protein n=1 Tax=Astyanax mexicanus TaxID=7994 RepID=A0A3B1J4B0_ASTMX
RSSQRCLALVAPLPSLYGPAHPKPSGLGSGLVTVEARSFFVKYIQLTDSSGGNRRVEVHIEFCVIWAAVVLCFLDTIRVSTRTNLADNLTWTLNTSSTAKKAQQRLYFLRKLRKARLPPPILTLFYRGTIESILSSCITAWFGTCTVSDRKTLQRIVRTAQRIIGVSLPSITDIYTTRSIRKATSIVNDPTHPSHELFSLLPSGRRYRSIRSSTTRFCNSFYPQAIRLLNCRD